jgi:putative thioredoxin
MANTVEVTDASFESAVLNSDKPVVVDFWATWCGPCRTLSPALEEEAAKHEGDVELVKVDVDRNQQLAMAFGIRGIPAVKAFRDGKVVDEFTGAIPGPQVQRFFDRLVPSEADRLAAAGDEQSLRRALELDSRNVSAAQRLGRLLLERGEASEALTILERFEGDFVAEGLAARARLAGEDGATPAGATLERAFSAWDQGDHHVALESLQSALAGTEDPHRRDLIRRVMVAIFTELGPDSALARQHRRRLATALS